MDPKNKNQNLTPELKEIYERVMNTQVKSSGTADKKPEMPQASSAPAPTPTVAPPVTPAASTPPPPKVAPGIAPATPAPADSNKPFLSSLPPRPVASDKPFVFNAGGKKAIETPGSKEPPAIDKSKAVPVAKPGKKVSKPVMILGGATFLVVYIVFWLKVLSFI